MSDRKALVVLFSLALMFVGAFLVSVALVNIARAEEPPPTPPKLPPVCEAWLAYAVDGNGTQPWRTFTIQRGMWESIARACLGRDPRPFAPKIEQPFVPPLPPMAKPMPAPTPAPIEPDVTTDGAPKLEV